MPPMVGWRQLCPACDAWLTYGAEVRHILRMYLAPGLDQVVEADILYCLWPDHLPRRRRYFLHYILISRGSPFRAFTYFSGGMAASIDIWEDVLTRIEAFV